jgi:hypothetical protein
MVPTLKIRNTEEVVMQRDGSVATEGEGGGDTVKRLQDNTMFNSGSFRYNNGQENPNTLSVAVIGLWVHTIGGNNEEMVY